MSKSPKKLLVVEDEPHLAFNLELNLKSEGYEVILAETGKEGLDLYHNKGPFSLILLDVMLPELNGFEVLQEIRRIDTKTGILMLTARASDEDVIRGLKTGADDYLTKPFHLEELLLRVKRMAKRSELFYEPEKSTDGEELLQLGNLELNMNSLVFKSSQGNFNITVLEAKVIKEFMNNPNKTLTREYLLEKVWGLRGTVETRTVDNFIMRIRKCVENNPSKPEILVSVRGKGYKLTIESEPT